MLGRDDGDAYERPAHRETLKAFFIDTYEVTCGDYEKFVKEKSHPAPAGWKGGACPEGAALGSPSRAWIGETPSPTVTRAL